MFPVSGSVFASEVNQSFQDWVILYKKDAVTKGVSQQTVDKVFNNVRFIDDVIRYDRKQPEFIEDTNTYVNKRASMLRANKAKSLLKKILRCLMKLKKSLV